MRADGNNVDVDREAANLAKTQLLLGSVMAVVTKSLHTMSSHHRGALMGLFDALDVAASGLTGERLRMDTIAANLANANSKGADGQPYLRQVVELAGAAPSAAAPAAQLLDLRRLPARSAGGGVKAPIAADRPPARSPRPAQPGCGRKGNVTMPNVNPVVEMVDLITATRGYEADTTAIKAVEGRRSTRWT